MKKIKDSINSKRNNLLIGATVLGLIMAVGTYVVAIHSATQALQAYEKGTIYIAAEEIPKGVVITSDNIAQYFECKEIDKSVIPDTALTTPEEVEGLIPVINIEKTTLLTRGMFESVNDITKNMEEPVIAGFKADDIFQLVGGTLRAGDRIHIYKTDENSMTQCVWNDIYVQQVFDNTGVQIANTDDKTSAQRINVYMDSDEIERFYSELSSGTLRVVKVCE